MVEFIKDTYWIKNSSAQYKDIRDRFMEAPFSLSEGSISNYIEELVDENKIRKVRDGNNVFYCPPKLSAPLRFGIIISALFGSISIPLFAFYNYISLPLLGFYGGVILTCYAWSNHKENMQKNGITNKKIVEKVG